MFDYEGLEPKYRCRVSGCEDGGSQYYEEGINEEGVTVQKLPSWYGNDSIGINDRCIKIVFSIQTIRVCIGCF